MAMTLSNWMYKKFGIQIWILTEETRLETVNSTGEAANLRGDIG